METISLKLDENNDLQFKVVVEGATGINRARLLVEGGPVDLVFSGEFSGDVVSVSIPSLKKVLDEGKYRANLEVIAEDRFFEPLSFNLDLKESVKVSGASLLQVNESRVDNNESIVENRVPIARAQIIGGGNKPVRAKRPSQASAQKQQKINQEELRVKRIIDRVTKI